ncbi:hypothetical protein AC578_1774 [Pseudocercospora eumusae]|uniref:Phosphatidylglycerol/phosphatidylinositol transfer protein n=1 Tax=Pseudocercospora eumusae TaxID=321146 RepID=A0A139H7I3_9PEZI|nr:hypothetical protein AC578_1774 [Pseudocercospora eumusae]
MKSLTYTLTALTLCTGAVLANPQDSYPIPGNTDFEYCDSDSANLALKITNLSLDPPNPKEGDTLKITYEMTTSSTSYFPPGSKVHYSIKWHGAQGPRGTFDPCKEFGGCPLSIPFKYEKEVKVPRHLPGRHYTGQVELVGPDGGVLGCVRGKLKIDDD